MKRITPEMAAAALGVPAQSIRVGLQQNKLDFGIAFKQKEDGARHTYYIFPEPLKEKIGEKAFNDMMQNAN